MESELDRDIAELQRHPEAKCLVVQDKLENIYIMLGGLDAHLAGGEYICQLTTYNYPEGPTLVQFLTTNGIYRTSEKIAVDGKLSEIVVRLIELLKNPSASHNLDQRPIMQSTAIGSRTRNKKQFPQLVEAFEAELNTQSSNVHRQVADARDNFCTISLAGQVQRSQSLSKHMQACEAPTFSTGTDQKAESAEECKIDALVADAVADAVADVVADAFVDAFVDEDADTVADVLGDDAIGDDAIGDDAMGDTLGDDAMGDDVIADELVIDAAVDTVANTAVDTAVDTAFDTADELVVYAAVDELVADKLVTDELVADELVADELVADKLVADALVADELVADELVTDALVADELVADALVADALSADALAADG